MERNGLGRECSLENRTDYERQPTGSGWTPEFSWIIEKSEGPPKGVDLDGEMVRDCDLRTANLIMKEVYRILREEYGPVYVVKVTEIRHEDNAVNVMGWFQIRPYEPEKWFAFKLPRVDGPLDHFL
jgi:hypothetical protein